MLTLPRLIPRQTQNHAPPFPDDKRETIYRSALLLLGIIDLHLTLDTRHYYDTSGNLLLHLDQIVLAILQDRLPPLEAR